MMTVTASADSAASRYGSAGLLWDHGDAAKHSELLTRGADETVGTSLRATTNRRVHRSQSITVIA